MFWAWAQIYRVMIANKRKVLFIVCGIVCLLSAGYVGLGDF